MKKIFLLLFVTLLALNAFAQSESNYQKRSLFEILPIHADDIVFLGNSITDYCEWAELFDNPHIKNRGISGDRSGWMLERLDPIIKGHPAQLFLLVGTNDLAAGIRPETVVANISKIVTRFANESPTTQVYIQSVFPVNGVDTKVKPRAHWKKGAEIIETNRLLQGLCAERGLYYLDIYTALVDDKGMLDKRYTNDGLHLMADGYLVWKEILKKYIK
ncbi:MAG: GDSL-type esterase/lipase family protein [Alistipes sp.]